METNQRTKGGFLLFTSEGGGLVAHLQRRGRYDYKHQRPNTWRDICRVTVEGNGRGNETPLQTAWRKMVDELLASSNLLTWATIIEHNLEENIVYRDKTKVTFGLVVPQEAIVPLRPQSSSGGLIRVVEADLQSIVVARSEWRTSPYTGSCTDIVTFPEVIKALKKGFAKFKNYQY